MADGDEFTRSVPARWRALAEALRAGLTAEVCAARLHRALARDLRECAVEMPALQALLGREHEGTERELVLVLQRLSRQQCLDRVLPRLIGPAHNFRDQAQAAAFIGLCFDQANMPLLARSLLKDPSGRSVSVPRPKRSNVDILAVVAPPGRNA